MMKGFALASKDFKQICSEFTQMSRGFAKAAYDKLGTLGS